MNLSKKTFIAVGDWNVDWKTSDLEGAKALQRLGAEFQMWREDHTITYVGGNFRSQLDYILLSNDLEIISGDVYLDFPKEPNLAKTASDHRAISVDFKFKKSN